MAQVLNDPPTLARWNQGIATVLSRAGTAFVFLLPAIVQSIVVFVQPEAVTRTRLLFQATLAIAIAILGLISYQYTVACDKRWRDMFFYINPGLEYVEQEPWLQWLRMIKGPLKERRERDIVRQLTYSLDVHVNPCAASSTISFTASDLADRSFRRRAGRILVTRKQLNAAAKRLVRRAEERCAASDSNAKGAVVRAVEISQNVAVFRNGSLDSWNVAASTRCDLSRPILDVPLTDEEKRLLNRPGQLPEVLRAALRYFSSRQE